MAEAVLVTGTQTLGERQDTSLLQSGRSHVMLFLETPAPNFKAPFFRPGPRPLVVVLVVVLVAVAVITNGIVRIRVDEPVMP